MPRVFRRTWTDRVTGKKKISPYDSMDFYLPDGTRVLRLVRPLCTQAAAAKALMYEALRHEAEPPALSAGSILSVYRKHLEANAPTTFATKKYWLDWWIDRLGPRSFAEITSADVNLAVLELQRAGLSPGTVGSYLRVLKSAFRKSAPGHELANMPIAFRSGRRTVTWTPEAVAEVCTKLPPWAAFLVRFLRVTGVRVGDALSLRWGNVRGDHLEWVQEKTRTLTAVPLSEAAQALLASQKPEGAKDGDLVFPGRRGQRRAYRNVLRVLYEATGHEKGSRGPGFHDLRRTFASGLHNAGVSDELIAQLLGQKTTTVVPLYRVTSAAALRAALASTVASIPNSPSGQVIHSAGSKKKQGNEKARRGGGP